jgi:glycerate 2-kinase
LHLIDVTFASHFSHTFAMSTSSPLPDYTTQPTGFLRALFDAAVARAQPAGNMQGVLPQPPASPQGRTLVVGAGKAAGAMVHALEAMWPADAPLSGLVITRYDHIPTRPAGVPSRIELVEAAHPVPDQAGMDAATRMLALAQTATAHDVVICLISGGGSSLLTLPCDGLDLADKQRINTALLNSGAGIAEMNCVRKHLSRIKGGRLAVACAAAQVVTIAISDVPGDDIGVIASGPTVPDDTTCAQAAAILRRLNIDLPSAVWQALDSGELETPKPGDAVFANQRVHLIATPGQSLAAAAQVAREAGIATYVLADDMEGESREVGKVHAAMAKAAALGRGAFTPPCVLLSGGETTVTINTAATAAGLPRGRGGRAAEFCMGLAQGLGGAATVWGLAADTDGIDGVQTNAGAVVTPTTLRDATAGGADLTDCLFRNDGYGYFEAAQGLVVTGPTHTNVNDFRALLVLPSQL